MNKKVKKNAKKKAKKPQKKVLRMRKTTLVRKGEAALAKSIKQNKNVLLKPSPVFKANVKVIGIGGGGGAIVSEIGRFLDKATFVVADTDVRAFKKRYGIKQFVFGQHLTHGLGTGLNPDLGRAAAEKEKDRIAKIFENQDIVIFVASLGGGLASGATRIFAEASKDFGAITFGIFTLPFKFEGRNKHLIAQKALKELRQFLNVSITIPNERIFKIIDENTPITEAFSMVNKNLTGSLESLIDLIYNPGIINIDFADVRTILRGKGNLAFLNTAEASGKDRAEKIIQKILHNPLYQTNNFTIEKILFNIMGGNNLSMFEVDKISKAIAEKNPKAKIIFGISRNVKYKNTIQTTLLMTGPGMGLGVGGVSEEHLEHAAESKEKQESLKVKKPKKKKKVKVAGRNQFMGTQPFVGNILPDFANPPSKTEPVGKLTVTEVGDPQRRTIRRTALEIKETEELEERKKSPQEKEWEIPAFLRKIKFKP